MSVLVKDETGDIRAVSSPKPTIPRRFRRRLEHDYPVCGNDDCRGDGPFEIDHIVARATTG